MPDVTIEARHAIPGFNAFTTLQAWLRPGVLAYVVACHADALRDHAVRIQSTREAMLDEAAQHEPDTIVGGPDDGKPNPNAGQRVVRQLPDGRAFTPYRSKDAGDDFERREAELFAAKITLTVDERFTLDHIRRIDAERLPTPRSLQGGAPPPDGSVDFAALIPFVERAAGTSSGTGTGNTAPRPGTPPAAPTIARTP